MRKSAFIYFKPILFLCILSFFSTFKIYAENIKPNENQLIHDSYDSKELKVGKRLFFGLIITGDNTINCASCHNTAVIDTFNWNPNALEIAISSQKMDSATFANSLLNSLSKLLIVIIKSLCSAQALTEVPLLISAMGSMPINNRTLCCSVRISTVF